MKNKKIIGICIIVLVILVGVIIGLIILQNSKKNSNNDDADAKKTVSEFLTAYHNKDEKAAQYLTTTFNDTKFAYKGFQGILAEKMTYKIIDSNVSKSDSTKTTIDVELNNVDVASILKKYEQSTETDSNKMLSQVENEINAKSAPMKIFKITVTVVDYPTGMKIVMSSDFSNALLGGYNEYISSIIQEDLSK